MKALYNLKKERADLLDAAEKALKAKNMEEYKAKMAEATELNEEIAGLEALEAEKGRFDETDEHMKDLLEEKQQKKADNQLQNAVNQIRAGNEYVNAFAAAMRNHIKPEDALTNEKYAPLVNAMTTSSGDPAGSEGGFLVPIEFDNMIHLKMKEFVQLSNFFNVENVAGLQGWRAVETSASRKQLPLIEEAANLPDTEKAVFTKVPYKIKDYGDRVPISNDLLRDNTAGLMQYMANWFAPRVVMTENSLFLELLNALEAKTLTAGREVAGIKRCLNRELNTTHSRNAILLTNQNGYDIMDQTEDKNGRPLLVPNPVDPNVYRFKGHQIVNADNDLIPDAVLENDQKAEDGTVTKAKGTYHPLYVGYMKAFGTLFRRQGLEFATTNIGGDAWSTNTTELRGICRMDVQKVDEKAVMKKEMFEA